MLPTNGMLLTVNKIASYHNYMVKSYYNIECFVDAEYVLISMKINPVCIYVCILKPTLIYIGAEE